MAQNHRLFLCHFSHAQNVEILTHILCTMHNMIKIEYGSETKRAIHYQCAAYVPVIAPHLMTTYIQIFKSTTEKL